MINGISIIIPCYNSEYTIIRALNSINLNNSKVEAIVIDDCSTDNSYNVVLNFKKANSNYNIILEKNTINLGPGKSRNKGLKLATKDYIMFLDADDIFYNYYYDEFNKLLGKKEYDCLIFDAVTVRKNNYKYLSMFYTNNINCGEISPKEAFVYSRACMCGKVYKREIIENNSIVFPEIKTNEDFVFNKIALSNSKTIFYINKPFYYYIYKEKSLTNNSEIPYFVRNEYKYKAFCLICSKINKKEWLKELNSVFMLEVIYGTSMNRIRSYENFSKFKSEFLNLLKKYDFNDPYFSRYCYKYRLVFKFLRAICCSI